MNKFKTLNIILCIVAFVLVTFIIAMIITFWKFQSVPDVLITCVLGTGTAELIASALITILKKKYKVDSHEENNDN